MDSTTHMTLCAAQCDCAKGTCYPTYTTVMTLDNVTATWDCQVSLGSWMKPAFSGQPQEIVSLNLHPYIIHDEHCYGSRDLQRQSVKVISRALSV